MMYYFYVFLGILLRRQAFEVNNGNDDWMDLVHPEKYGLTQTQNFYMAVIILSFIKLLNSDNFFEKRCSYKLRKIIYFVLIFLARWFAGR